jgi:hypothetical protein
MAVLVRTRHEVEDVALGRPLRSGPRVLPRRPATRPRPVVAVAQRESRSCQVRPRRQVLELVAVGVLSMLTVVAIGLMYLQQLP